MLRTGSKRAAGTEEGLAKPVKPRPGEEGMVVVGGGVAGIGEGGGEGMWCVGDVAGFGERGAVG